MPKESNKPHACNHICFCPIEGIIDIISKKWALLIINGLRNQGTLRFNDLMKELNGISPKTLSDTLKELQAEGLIKRESFAEIPPRVEYSLTEDGADLGVAILPLIRWAALRGPSKNCTSTCRGSSAHRVTNPEKNKGTDAKSAPNHGSNGSKSH